MKICIDCDPGVDDSLAILFALARPDVEAVSYTHLKVWYLPYKNLYLPI